MGLLRTLSWVATLALIGMTIFVWGRRLDMSRGGLRHLRKGVTLSCISAALLAAVTTLWMGGSTKGFYFLFVLMSMVGNLSNLTSLLYGLRELNGETVSAGLLIIWNQMLWFAFVALMLKAGGA